MAIKKPLTLLQLAKDPARLTELTTPQLQELAAKLKELFPAIHQPEIPPTPALLAEKLSRGRWAPAKHLQFISNILAELEAGKREKILVSTPPRHGKSFLISQWFPLWLLARKPDRRIILASYEAEFATSWGIRVRNLVADYGEDLGIKLDTSMPLAGHNWNLTSGGGMVTAGAGGPITGKGADFLIIDDPIKNEEEASSEILREKLWNWWQTVALTRLEPGGKVILIMTRWHQDDLFGRLRRDSESGEGTPWDVVNLPAIAEEGDQLGRAIGEPLWPDRIPLEELLGKRKGMSPYNWSALFQQNPTPEEGGAVKRKWWKFYQVPPAEFDQVIQSWDLSFKDLKQSDFTVGQVWGRKGAEFFLLDQVRGRMDAPETISAFRNLWRRHPKGLAKLVEDRANGPAVLAMLNQEIPGLVPVKIKASKEARLSAVLPLFEAGNVYVPHPETHGRWVSELIEECAAFPNGTNDDQVDALSQALNFLQPAGWREVGRSWKEALEPPAPQSTQEIVNRRIHDGLRRRQKERDREWKEHERAEEEAFFAVTERPW